MAELIRIADMEVLLLDLIKHTADCRERAPVITGPLEAARYQGSLEGQEKAYKTVLHEIKRIGRE